MKFSRSRLFSQPSPAKRPARRSARFERLENRELLALTVGSADFKALADSFVADETDDAAIWVTTLADSASQTDGQISLREALDYAGTKIDGKTLSSTIRFSLGGTIELSRTLTIINKDVTVDASDVGGVVVDRGGKGQVLLLTNASANAERSVSLIGLTLTGGAANPSTTGGTYKGVGVQVGAHFNLTATNCAIVGNSSSAALGAGIYVQGGRLTLIDSTVSGNSAGGAASVGGGIYVDGGDLTLTRTTVANNSAAVGGGVYLKGGSAVLDGATFLANSATLGSGGGFYNFAGYLDVENASFLGNGATGSGGGLYNVGVEGRETLVVDATFNQNVAANGGAIYNYGGAFSLTGARFEENEATEAGGAIYVDSNAELKLVDAEFNENFAEEIGGGSVFNGGVLSVDGARFNGDATGGDGGSVFSTGYFEIRDAAFANASATNGGALAVESESTGSTSWILASSFENCVANVGGAISLDGSLSGAELRFFGCAASSGGGAVSNAGTLVLSGVDFDRCDAANDGGALLNWSGAQLTLADATVSNAFSTGESGGGLANYGAATLSGVSFVGCEAALFGGAIVNGGTLTVYDSLFLENAAKNGGAVSNASSGVATFENSTFWANRATQNGGAAHCVGKTTFKNAYVARNVASTAASAATYRNPASEYEPTFDAKTTVVDNVAASNASTPTFADSILFLDAETNEALDGAPLNFGNLPVNGAETTRTVAILNAGTQTVAFSNLAISGVEAATLLYEFRRADGSTVDPTAFQLAPGETVYATLTIAPKKLGAKYFAFDWTARTVAADSGALGPAETARLSASVQVEKQASTTVSGVSSLELNVATQETFAFALKTKPTSNVVVYLAAPDGVLLSTDVLVFTPANYNVAQSVGVSLDEAFFADGGSLGASVVIEPKILSSETAFAGATVADVSLSVGARLSFVGDSLVDLSAVAPTGTTVWDLDGDGSYETRTQSGTSTWVSSADVKTTADFVAYQTVGADGKRKTGRAEVLRVDALPVVSAETTVFSALPGVVRLSLTSPDAAITRWRVNWGDGRPADVLDETATSAVFGHIYDADGEYDICAELIDANGVGTGVWSFVGTVVVSGLGTSQAVFAELGATDETLAPADFADFNADAVVAETLEADVVALSSALLDAETERRRSVFADLDDFDR